MAEIKTPGLDEIIANSGKAAKGISMPGLDSYISTRESIPAIQQTGPSPAPRSVEELRSRASEAVPEPSLGTKLGQIGAGYLGSVREHAESAAGMMGSGKQDFLGGSYAPGIGKLGLGLIGYPLSVVTGGLHELGKVGAKIGGENFGEKVELLAGGALPIGVGGRAVAKRIPTNAALEAITSSVTPAELADGLQRLRANPNLSVMDVFPSVKQMGQKLILTEGLHQNKFVKFIEDRIGGRKNAIEDIYHETMGAPPNVLLKLNELKKNIKDAGKEINPVIENAGPVDISEVIKNIDAKLKPGVTSVITAGEPLPLDDSQKGLELIRKYLTDDKSNRVDAKTLHDFQSAIRATADNLMNSKEGADRTHGYHLMNARNDLVNAIENAAPGYKAKLAKYRDEYQVQDAFNKGYLITKNRAGVWEDRPEFWQDWIRTASKEEREAAREGAKVAFDDTINAARHAGRKGMDIPETPFNRQKIEALFGKKETDEMVSRLRDERGISETNAEMIKGSQTAMRNKANTKVDLPERKDKSILGSLALLTEAAGYIGTGYSGAGALTTVPRIIGAGKHKFVDLPLARAKNERLTDLLTSTGEDRNALIQMLENSLPQSKLSLGQKTKLMIGNP